LKFSVIRQLLLNKESPTRKLREHEIGIIGHVVDISELLLPLVD
jgi:hypothetical protein